MRLLVAAILLLAAASPTAAADLTERIAIEAIEKLWRDSFVTVLVGDVSVTRTTPRGDRELGADIFKSVYKQLADAGYLTIEEDPASASYNAGESFSWGQFLNSTVGGVQARVRITPTARALDGDLEGAPDGQIWWPLGTQRVTKVVSIETLRRGVDDYGIVRVLYDAQFTDFFRSGYYPTCGDRTGGEKQKAIVLLKHDPFAGEWKWVTEDDAAAAEEFCTKYVSAVVGE